MSTQVKLLYEFGSFRLDPEACLLLREGQPIALTPKTFDALLLLVKHSGRLVSKDELMEALWPDTFVEESNLTQTVFMLRKALGETGNDQRFIVTTPGRGYRFAADVKEVSVNRSMRLPLTAARAEAPPQPERPSHRRWALVGVAIGLVACIGIYFLWSHSRDRFQGAGERWMLAVLPFENLTGDAGQDYFSDGLTEEMIAQLGRLDPQHLGVIARTSVMHYKHNPQSLDQIGRELGVQYVLEGSVRRDAGRVRITAQLIQVRGQNHVWARQYDRDLTDLLALQGEVAQEIADEIESTLGENQRVAAARPPQLSPATYEAHDLYLRGQYFFNQRTLPGFEKAIEYFQQAIAKDPNYARAYAGLADCYALRGAYSGAPQTESVANTRAAALRALQMDERLPEAHTALALIVQNYDWDWQTAEQEFRRAIELDPNYATAHHWYAEHLMWRGRFGEALQESEKARQLDPLSLIIAADNGVILFYSRHYDRAIDQFRVVLDMDPNFSRARMIEYAYAQKGMFPQALADIEKHRPNAEAGQVWHWAILAYVQGRAGQRAEAQKALERLERLSRQQQVDPAVFVAAYVGIGDKEQALAWLEKAYAQHSNSMPALKVDPLYDPLRADPRFQDLLRRVGLAQ